MLGLLGGLLLCGSLICYIIVLIKQFQDGGAVQGIIGLLCSLWTFIWGWMNAGRLNIRNIMMIWTALIILGTILTVAGGGFNFQFGTPVTTP